MFPSYFSLRYETAPNLPEKKKMKAKMINATEFQRKVLELIRKTQCGDEEYIIIRNSRPAAALIAYDIYEKMVHEKALSVSSPRNGQ